MTTILFYSIILYYIINIIIHFQNLINLLMELISRSIFAKIVGNTFINTSATEKCKKIIS